MDTFHPFKTFFQKHSFSSQLALSLSLADVMETHVKIGIPYCIVGGKHVKNKTIIPVIILMRNETPSFIN